jgi:hypothetical protein
MRLAACLLGLTLLTSVPGHAFNEPDGFRGAPWGASEAEVKEKAAGSHAACLETPSQYRWLADRTCHGEFDLGSVTIKAHYSFRGDRFTGASLTFPAEGFDAVEHTFIQRYGPPTSTEDEPGKTRAGLEFLNRRHMWIGPKIVIRLVRYGDRLTHSSASLRTHEDLATSRQLREQQLRDAAKGL